MKSDSDKNKKRDFSSREPSARSIGIRNDNAGHEVVRDHPYENHKSAIKRRSFFGYGIAGAIGFVLAGSFFQKASKMISSKKEEKKISVSIHKHAVARNNSGLSSNGGNG